MFGKNFKLGRIFGIELTLSWSFLVLIAALSIYLALQSGNFLAGLAVGLASLSLVFASVLAHELGHSLVARKLGLRIQEIELHLFGGAAKLLDAPKKPRDEIVISAAGPAVSFVLAGLFWTLGLLGVEAAGIIGSLARVNLLLGAFNLIPALPTDGGRILRAALALRLGPLAATRKAVTVARVATIGLGAFGLLSGNFFMAAIAVFLWILGTRELAMAQLVASSRAPFVEQASSAGWSQPSTRVEVFDREGRFIGLAPGGVELANEDRARGSAPRSSPGYAPRAEQDPLFHQRRVIVQGQDGRLWVMGSNAGTWTFRA